VGLTTLFLLEIDHLNHSVRHHADNLRIAVHTRLTVITIAGQLTRSASEPAFSFDRQITTGTTICREIDHAAHPLPAILGTLRESQVELDDLFHLQRLTAVLFLAPDHECQGGLLAECPVFQLFRLCCFAVRYAFFRSA